MTSSTQGFNLNKSHLYDYACPVHRRVYFSDKELEKHLIQCHIENIKILPGKDPLGRKAYNMFSEMLDKSPDMCEEEKESFRNAYFW